MVPNAWSSSGGLDVLVRTNSRDGAAWNRPWRRRLRGAWSEAIGLGRVLRSDVRCGSILHRSSLCPRGSNRDGRDAAAVARNTGILRTRHRLDGSMFDCCLPGGAHRGCAISVAHCSPWERKEGGRLTDGGSLRLEYNWSVGRFASRWFWIHPDVFSTGSVANRRRPPFCTRRRGRMFRLARSIPWAPTHSFVGDGSVRPSDVESNRADRILASQ